MRMWLSKQLDGIIVDPMTVVAKSGGGDTAASIRDVAATGSAMEVSTGGSAAAVEDVPAFKPALEVSTGGSAEAVEDAADMGSTLDVGTGGSAAAVEDVPAFKPALEVGTGGSAAAVEDVPAFNSTLEVGTGGSAAAVEDVPAFKSTPEVGPGGSAAAVEDVPAFNPALEVGTGGSAAAVEDVPAFNPALEVGTGGSAAVVEDVPAFKSTLEVGTGGSAAAVEDVMAFDSALEVNAVSSQELQALKLGLPIADSDPDEDEVPAHSLQHYDIPIPPFPEMDITPKDLLSLLVQISSSITAVSGSIQPSKNFKEVAFRAPLDVNTNGWEYQAKEGLELFFDKTAASLQWLRSPPGQQLVTFFDVDTRYFISQKIVRSAEPHLVALQDVALLLDPTDDALTYLVAQGADEAALKRVSSADFFQKSGIPTTPDDFNEILEAVKFCSFTAGLTRLFSGANPSEAASAIARYDGDNADDQNTTGTFRTAALSARTAIRHLLKKSAPVLFGLATWEELAACLSSDVRYVISQLILQSREPPLIALRPVALQLNPSMRTQALMLNKLCPPSPCMILQCWQLAAMGDWFYFNHFSGKSKEIQKQC
eukprot:gene20316-27072_t